MNQEPSRYQIFTGMAENLTISEMHKLVHSLWKAERLQDVVEVQSLNDRLILTLLEKPLLPERYDWEEEQPHVQLNDMLESVENSLLRIKQSGASEEGERELARLLNFVGGVISGNRFARHPKQRIVNYR